MGPVIHGVLSVPGRIVSLEVTSKNGNRVSTTQFIRTLMQAIAQAALMHIGTIPPRTSPTIESCCSCPPFMDMIRIQIVGALTLRIRGREQGI